MLGPLPTTLNSYSRMSRATVQSLVRDMKIDKIELENAIKKMSTYSSGSSFAASQVGNFSPLDKQILVDLFRDSFLKLKQYFGAMNTIGLAINSMVSVFTSEIEKIEKDIENLELFINNYEFISGKDDLFNFNYLEKFSDRLGEYQYDGSNFLIPDRDGLPFPLGGNGFIDNNIGAFKFGSSATRINVQKKIKKITVKTNYENYISTNSDPITLFNDSLTDSWNITIKSPTILTSEIAEFSEYLPYDTTSIVGARAAIDISFTEAISMDSIRFSPNLGHGLDLLQVVIFSKDLVPDILLSQPISLRGVKELSFSKRLVTRFIFIINQQEYTRNKPTPITSELNSKALSLFVEEQLAERNSRFSKYQDMVYWYFLNKTRINKVSKTKTEFDFYSSKIPIELDRFANVISDELFASSNFGLDYKYELTRSPVLINLIQTTFQNLTKDSKLIKSTTFVEGYGGNALSRRLLDSAGFIYGGKSTNYYDIKEQFYNYPIAVGGVETAVRSLLINESQDIYEYIFSLRSIEFIETGTDNISKACFVSGKIPSNNSQIVGIKAKMDIKNSVTNINPGTYNLKSPVSLELSVSTVEIPEKESHWYPLAFNGVKEIDSEVIFFDKTEFSSTLRFHPIPGSIYLYRDGIPITQFKYYENTNKIYLIDKTLYSPGNIFCVKYELDLIRFNPHELDLVKENLFYDAVKTFADSSGEGQGFRQTDSSGKVILEYAPYINLNLASNSIYSNTIGTIFRTNSTGYSPVRIKLNDGTFAINLTNYTNKPQDINISDLEDLAFLHSGRNIIFNRQVTDPFRVYYDYIPNILRFRLIMRQNIPQLKVPLTVDNILLKMKTFNFDPYYDKLTLSTSGRQ